jgi:hypothetical protein
MLVRILTENSYYVIESIKKLLLKIILLLPIPVCHYKLDFVLMIKTGNPNKIVIITFLYESWLKVETQYHDYH